MSEPRRIVMPRIDPSMDRGKIVEWLKKEGDKVSKGEPIAVIEGEKTAFEVESEFDGILNRILREVGEEVSVGEPIAEVLPETVAAPQAEVVEREEIKVRASPAARKLAQEYGIDLSKVRGTGPEGLITREDVLREVQAAKREVVEEEEKVIKLSGVRKAVADRLSYSFHTSAPVTLTTEFDATRLIDAYERLKRQMGERAPGITSLIIKVCASLLKENKEFNAVLEGENLRIRNEVNISVAIDTPSGLYAPVIKNADKLSLEEIEEALRKLQEKAMSGKLSHEDLSGHTFTITNLGGEGVFYFTPILNPPAICILGVGAIVKKPVFHEGEVSVRSIGHLSLVFDHRAVDGAPAARFLAAIKGSLENYQ